MRSWVVGRVKISKIVEIEAGGFGTFLLPDALPQDIEPLPGILPQHIDDHGGLKLSVHSFVLETPEKTILVDACVGNDKIRTIPVWNRLNTGFLEKLSAAGYQRDDIDVVVCTHLHIDHVGWNTMLVEGQWVPTFARARYKFVRAEYEFWKSGASDPGRKQLFEDSIDVVVDAGMVDFVDDTYRLTEEIVLVPSPGHTPGHVSVLIESLGKRGFITGDFIHHPVQLQRNDWCTRFDVASDAAMATRLMLVSKLADGNTLVFGTAFPEPSVGYFARLGSGFVFEPVEPHG